MGTESQNRKVRAFYSAGCGHLNRWRLERKRWLLDRIHSCPARPPQIRLGTSAFTAAGWPGTFYPAGMKEHGLTFLLLREIRHGGRPSIGFLRRFKLGLKRMLCPLTT